MDTYLPKAPSPRPCRTIHFPTIWPSLSGTCGRLFSFDNWVLMTSSVVIWSSWMPHWGFTQEINRPKMHFTQLSRSALLKLVLNSLAIVYRLKTDRNADLKSVVYRLRNVREQNLEFSVASFVQVDVRKKRRFSFSSLEFYIKADFFMNYWISYF